MPKVVDQPVVGAQAAEVMGPETPPSAPSIQSTLEAGRFDMTKSNPLPDRFKPDPYIQIAAQNEIQEYLQSPDAFVVLDNEEKVPAAEQLRKDGYGAWMGGFMNTIRAMSGIDQMENDDGFIHDTKAYYSYRDPETGILTMKRSSGDLKDLQKISGNILSHWGPKDIKDNFFQAVSSSIHDNLGVGTLGLVNDLVQGTGNLTNFIEEGSSLDQQLDKNRILMESMRTAGSLNKDLHDTFDTAENFGEGVGSMISSLIQFGVGGGAAGGLAKMGLGAAAKAGAKVTANMAKASRAVAYMGAGTVINGGEAYNVAREYNLPKDDAALLALSVGLVAAAIEMKVGTNVMTDWALGMRQAGKRPIIKALMEEVGEKNIKEGVDKALPGTINKITGMIQDWQQSGGAKGIMANMASSSAEEATEEFLQNSALETAKYLYDISSDDPEFGGNMFTDEYFKDSFESAALGGIMGFAGGGMASIRGTNQPRTVLETIASGQGKDVQESLEVLKSTQSISEPLYAQMKERVDQLTELYGDNTEIFGELNRRQKGKLLAAVETNFSSKKALREADEALGELDQTQAIDAAKRLKSFKLRNKKTQATVQQEVSQEIIGHYLKGEDGTRLADQEGYSDLVKSHLGDLAAYSSTFKTQKEALEEIAANTQDEGELREYEVKIAELDKAIKKAEDGKKELYQNVEARNKWNQEAQSAKVSQLIDTLTFPDGQYVRMVNTELENVDRMVEDGNEVFTLVGDTFTNAVDNYDDKSIRERDSERAAEAEAQIVEPPTAEQVEAANSADTGNPPPSPTPPTPASPASPTGFAKPKSSDIAGEAQPKQASASGFAKPKATDVASNEVKPEPANPFETLVDKAVSERELDAILAQADKAKATTPDLITQISKKRELLKNLEGGTQEIFGVIDTTITDIENGLVPGVVRPVVGYTEDAKGDIETVTYIKAGTTNELAQIAIDTPGINFRAVDKQSKENDRVYIMGTPNSPLEIKGREEFENEEQEGSFFSRKAKIFNNPKSIVDENVRIVAHRLTEKGREESQRVVDEAKDIVEYNGGIIFRNFTKGLSIQVEFKENGVWKKGGYIENPYGYAKRMPDGSIQLLDPETLTQKEFYSMFRFMHSMSEIEQGVLDQDQATAEFNTFIETWKDARAMYDQLLEFSDANSKPMEGTDLAYEPLQVPTTVYEFKEYFPDNFVAQRNHKDSEGNAVSYEPSTPLSQVQGFTGFIYDSRYSKMTKVEGESNPSIKDIPEGGRYYAWVETDFGQGMVIKKWIPIYPRKSQDFAVNKENTTTNKAYLEKIKTVLKKLESGEVTDVKEADEIARALNQEQRFMVFSPKKNIAPIFSSRKIGQKFTLVMWNQKKEDGISKQFRIKPSMSLRDIATKITEEFGGELKDISIRYHASLDAAEMIQDSFQTDYQPNVVLRKTYQRIYYSNAGKYGSVIYPTKSGTTSPDLAAKAEKEKAKTESGSFLDQIEEIRNSGKSLQDQILSLNKLVADISKSNLTSDVKLDLIDKVTIYESEVNTKIADENSGNSGASFQRLNTYVKQNQYLTIVHYTIAAIYRDEDFGSEDISVLVTKHLRSLEGHLNQQQKLALESDDLGKLHDVRKVRSLFLDEKSKNALVKDISKAIEKSVVYTEEDELEGEDEIVNVRNYEKNATEYDPTKRLGRKVKQLLGTLTVAVSPHENQLFGWGKYRPVNVKKVYSQLVNRSTNKSIEDTINLIMELGAPRSGNKEMIALREELIRISEEEGYAGGQMLINFFKGLDLVSTDYIGIVREDKSWSSINKLFSRSPAEQLVSKWTKKYESLSKNLTSKRRKDISSELQMIAVGEGKITPSRLREVFGKIGITAHKDFWNISANFLNGKGETKGKGDPINLDFIREAANIIKNEGLKGNPFTNHTSSQSLGLVGRLKRIATLAATFDDGIYQASVLDSENKQHYINVQSNDLTEKLAAFKEEYPTQKAIKERKPWLKHNYFLSGDLTVAKQTIGSLKIVQAGDIYEPFNGRVYKHFESGDYLLEALVHYIDGGEYAYYPFRINADSSQSLSIRAPKNMDLYTENDVSAAVDAVYNSIFIPEFERITKNIQPDSPIALKTDKKFKHLDIFENLENTDGESLADILRREGITPTTEKSVRDTLENYISQSADFLETKSRKLKVRNKSVKSLLRSPKGYKSILGNFFVEHWLTSVATSQILDLSPDTIQKSFHVERIKRNKGAFSSRGINQELDFGAHQPMTMFQSDMAGKDGTPNKIKTVYITEAIDENGSNTDDAQVYISGKLKAQREEAFGRIDESLLEGFVALAEGRPIPANLQRRMDLVPDKTSYYDAVRYHKKSDFVLSYDLVHLPDGTPNPRTPRWYKMWQYMDKHSIDQIVTLSASKLRNTKAIDTGFFDDAFDLETPPPSIDELDLKSMKLQVENDSKTKKGSFRVTLGVQIMELLGVEMSTPKAKALQTKLNEQFAAMRKEDFDIIKTRMAPGGVLDKDFIYAHIEKTLEQDPDPQISDFLERDKDGNIKGRIDNLHLESATGTKFLSIFKEDVLRSSMPGFKATLISGNGFKVLHKPGDPDAVILEGGEKVVTEKTINVYWGQAESEKSTKILSNLAPRKFTWKGKEYGSVEHAYQSNKSGTFDQDTYNAYSEIDGHGKKIRGKGTVAEMKAADSLGLMKQLVVESFKQNADSEAAKKLMQYTNFTHNTNQLIDQAFLEGLKMAQTTLQDSGLKLEGTQSNLRDLRMQKSEDGKFTYAEVAITKQSAGLLGLKVGATITQAQLEKIGTMLGYRIPTQSHHSMLAFKVAAWLPESYGDSIVVPKGLPKIMGADFDVDSLYIFRKGTYKDANGNLKIYGQEKTSAEKWEAYKAYHGARKFVKGEIRDILNSDTEYLNAKADLNILRSYIRDDRKLGLTESIQVESKEVKRLEELINTIEEEAREDAFEKFGLAIDFEEFKKGGYTNNGITKNEILDSMLKMMEQPDIKESLETPADPADIQKTSDFVQEKYGLGSKFRHIADFVLKGLHPIGTFLGMMSDREAVNMSKANVGLMANINSASSFLTRNGYTLKTPFRIDGKDYADYSVLREDDYDLETGEIIEGVRRKKETSSNLLTIATDDVKLRVSKTLNYTTSMLSIAGTLVELGYGEKRANILINQPVLREITEKFGDPDPYKMSVILDDLYATLESWYKIKILKLPAGEPVKINLGELTTENMVKSLDMSKLDMTDSEFVRTQLLVLKTAMEARKNYSMIATIAGLNKLNSQVPGEGLDGLSYLQSKVRKKLYGIPPSKNEIVWNDVFTKGFEMEPLQKTNWNFANFIQETTGEMFLSQHRNTREVFEWLQDAVAVNLGEPLAYISTEGKNKFTAFLQTLFLSDYLVEKHGLPLSRANYLLLENEAVSIGKKTVAAQFKKVLENNPGLSENMFMQQVKPLFASSSEADSGIDTISRISNATLEPEVKEQVLEGFKDMLNTPGEVSKLANNIFLSSFIQHSGRFSGLGLMSLFPVEVFAGLNSKIEEFQALEDPEVISVYTDRLLPYYKGKTGLLNFTSDKVDSTVIGSNVPFEAPHMSIKDFQKTIGLWIKQSKVNQERVNFYADSGNRGEYTENDAPMITKEELLEDYPQAQAEADIQMQANLDARVEEAAALKGKPIVDKSKSFKFLQALVAGVRSVFTPSGVYTMRTTGNEHFGNPWTGSGKGKGTIKLGTVEKAVEAYEQWLTGGKYQDVKPEQRKWIQDQVKNPESELRKAIEEGQSLLYMNDRTGYRSHADVLAELVQLYSSRDAKKAAPKKSVASGFAKPKPEDIDPNAKAQRLPDPASYKPLDSVSLGKAVESENAANLVLDQIKKYLRDTNQDCNGL